MTKILPHDPAKSQILSSYAPRRDEDAVASAKNTSSHQSAVQPTEDKAEISTEARAFLDLRAAVDVGRTALEHSVEDRGAKLASVRERVASGFYDSADVRDKVAGRLASMFMDHPLF